MKNIVLSSLLFALFFSFAIGASTNSPYPYDKFNYLHSQENAIPDKHLHPKVSLYYWYYTANEFFNEDGHREDYDKKYTQGWFVPAFSFGAGNVAEFGMAIPILSENSSSETYDYGDMNGSGIGDLLLWVKVAVTQKPWFGFRFAAKLPTGNDDYESDELPVGSGQTDIDLGWQFSYKPDKMGFLSDINISYRLRLAKDIENTIITMDGIPMTADRYDPGEEGRLGMYFGGMPVEGFGIMFGGDGFITFNDQYEGDYLGHNEKKELKKSYRASSFIGLKMFYEFPFGLRFDGGAKTDIAGKDSPAGFGFDIGISYQPEF
ncbi:transporter [bacterium]|nr:transporter [bacterium]